MEEKNQQNTFNIGGGQMKLSINVMMMTAILILIIIIGTIISTQPSALFGAQKEEVIKIGLSMPLTGDAANWGEEVKKGAQIAIEELASETINGKKLSFIIEDDKCDAKEAINTFHKLTEIDQTKIIAGNICSTATLAQAPLAEKNKILLFATGSSNPKIKNFGQYIFSLWPLDDQEGKVMADYITQKVNSKKIAILYINNEYGVGLKTEFENVTAKNKGTITSSEPFNKGEKDFRTQIEKTKNSSPEVVYIVSNPEELPALLKQIKQMNLKQPIFANGVAIETKEIMKNNLPLAEEIIYAMPKSALAAEFKAKYETKYNSEAGLIASKGYDTIKILYNALKNCQNDDTTCMKDYLHKLKNYPTASGEISFDESGSISSAFEIKQIKNGKITTIE